MKRIQKKKKRKISSIWLMYIGVLAFAFFIMNTNSRYLSEATGAANIQIAEPVIEMIKVTNTNIEVNCVEKEIEFEVKNKNLQNRISDVTFKYQLNIATENNIPVEYKLYKKNGGTRTEILLNNGKTGDMLMGHSVEQIDSFVLIIKMNDKKHQGKTDNIDVSLIARQINESEI